MSTPNDFRALWDRVVEHIKLTIIHPTLWRSLELAVPVIVECGEFVVGFAPNDYHMSGNLTVSEHRNAIDVALQQFSGVPIRLRIIEGTTLEDWAHAKVRDQSMEALREADRRKREKARSVRQSWEGLLEQISRKYANTPLRQLPQARAVYLQEILELMSDAMDDLMPEDGSMDELAERSLARAIDKVGQLAEIPGPLVALELLKMRQNLK